jgi:hypothetical protein
MKGNGFQLSSFRDGVMFDVASCGTERQTSWTARGSDDAFLVLDRNRNGVVDGGKELFGNNTEQPNGERPSNGFEALRVLDVNGDGQVSAADPMFASLQLWVDRNHNGRSEHSEIRGLWESGVESISVQYRQSRRKDQFGNSFKWRARVAGAAGPFAYDVYFVLTDPEQVRPGGRRPIRVLKVLNTSEER